MNTWHHFRNNVLQRMELSKAKINLWGVTYSDNHRTFVPAENISGVLRRLGNYPIMNNLYRGITDISEISFFKTLGEQPPYKELDNEVRELVRFFFLMGFSPCDSDNGRKRSEGMECALDEPHVILNVGEFYSKDDIPYIDKEKHRLLKIMQDHEIVGHVTILPPEGENYTFLFMVKFTETQLLVNHTTLQKYKL